MKSFFLSSRFKILAFFLVAALTIGASLYAALALGDFVNQVLAKGIGQSYLPLVLLVVFQIAFRIGNVFGDWVFKKIKLDSVRISFLKKLQSNKGSETAWNESNKYFDDYLTPIFNSIHASMGVLGSIAAIAVVSWPVALVALVGFVIAYAASFFMNKRLAALSQAQLTASNALSRVVNRMEANVASLGDYGNEAGLAMPSSENLRDATRKEGLISAARNGALNFTSGGLYVAIVVTTAFLINSGQTNIGTLVVAGAVSATIYAQIPGLAGNIASAKANKWLRKINDRPAFSWGDPEYPKVVVQKIVAVDLGKSIGGKTILDKVNLSLEMGDSLRVRGANGSGKTTFARILCGLDEPTSGEIKQFPLARTQYAQMPYFYQTSASKLLAGTVRQNITCFAANYDQRLLLSVADRFFIADKLNREVSQLSSGEQALVKIAVTVFSKASVKVYDELFANVDAGKREIALHHALNSGGINIVVAHHGVKNKFSKELLIKRGTTYE